MDRPDQSGENVPLRLVDGMKITEKGAAAATEARYSSSPVFCGMVSLLCGERIEKYVAGPKETRRRHIYLDYNIYSSIKSIAETYILGLNNKDVGYHGLVG